MMDFQYFPEPSTKDITSKIQKEPCVIAYVVRYDAINLYTRHPRFLLQSEKVVRSADVN